MNSVSVPFSVSDTGRQLAGALLFFVPRSVWAAKPPDSASLIIERKGGEMTNVSVPLWAEGYLNAGLLGTVLLLALAGVIAAELDHKFRDVSELAGRHGLFTAFAAPYSLILLRGSLLQAVSVLAVLIICTLVVGRRRKV
jgi:hypothetical protein